MNHNELLKTAKENTSIKTKVMSYIVTGVVTLVLGYWFMIVLGNELM